MPEIKLDTFDVELLMDKVNQFLKEKNISEVKFNYFSLDDDDEVSETLPLADLKERVVAEYENEDGHFYFSAADCIFDYDGSEFTIKFPESVNGNIFLEQSF